MKLQSLSLIFFKNHSDFKWEGVDDVVAIAGLNGAGKTSILDAIHFLCVGKSYFASTDVQCIQNDALQSGIIAKLKTDKLTDLKIKLKRGGRKVIERDGVPYKKMLEHIGQFLAVVIAPSDIELVYGSNEKRRSFINQILCQVDGGHLIDLMTYNKLLDHRNKHLKQDMIDDALIQTLDTQIAPLAQAIYAKRETFLSEFSAVFANEYHRISGERERIILHYTSQLQSNSYLDVAAHCRSKDLVLQRSNGGVHKDELELELGGLNLRKYGSQGQIKSSLIALKLAEYKYLQKHTSKNPFLLLDDIFEKIDEERAQVLTQIIKNDNFGQIFITDTNEHRLTAFCEAIGKPYTTLLLA